jgi:hypothetical protein
MCWTTAGRATPAAGANTIWQLERWIQPFLKRFGDRAIADGIARTEAKTFVAEHGRYCAAAARALFDDLVTAGLTASNPFRSASLRRHDGLPVEVISDADFEDLTRLAGRVWHGAHRADTRGVSALPW